MTTFKTLAAAVTLLGLSTLASAAGLTPAQLAKITRGLTQDQVLALAGKPARNLPTGGPFGGRTWVYALAGGTVANGTILEVDFSPEGQVVKLTQRFAQDFE